MKVLFVDTVHSILQERLEKLGCICIDGHTLDFNQTKTLLSEGIEGIVVRSRFRMDEKLLGSASNLKFIARSGAGMENIDEAFTASRNIQLFNAPEGNRVAVAEHALGMLLALFNQLKKGDFEVRQGLWDREGNRGLELTGKTVGIIGYGNNGSSFAKLLKAFDCRILAYDKYVKVDEDGVEQVEMKQIYQDADVVSFHIPQNNETIYWGNDTFFESFSKSIYLINLSRGKVVSIEALMRAIDNGKVAGAVLDVLEYESASFEQSFSSNMPDHFQKLINSDKVLLSPHVGGWTVESYFKLSNVLADKIENYFF